MTPEQFCYWLQGRAELDTTPPTPEQWKSICEHLATVFIKVTPPVGQDGSKPAKPFFDDFTTPIPSTPKWPSGPFPPTITCTTDGLTKNPIDNIFIC